MNLIENGGFEDLPILTEWDCAVSFSGGCGALGPGNNGSRGGFVFDNVGVGALSQTFATVVGTTYNVVFFLATNKVNTPETNVFSYQIADAAPVSVSFAQSNVYTQVTSSFGALQTESTLSFFADTSFRSGSLYVDDVSVTARSVAPIPLPAGGWLLLAGVAGLVAARRRAA